MIAFLALQTGCGSGPKEATADSGTNVVAAILYLNDPSRQLDPYDPKSGVESVSVLNNHDAVLCLMEPSLQTAQAVEFRLVDAKGVPQFTNAAKPLTPAGSKFAFARTSYQPNYLAFQPGLWKWTATVDGKTAFTKEFAIDPLDEREKQRILLGRRAIQEVARVFSHYWQTDGEHAYTGFTINEVNRGTRPERKSAGAATNNPVRTDPAPEPTATEPKVVVQVKSMVYQIQEEPISSEADLANQVHFRGRAQFGFGIYRQSTNGLGWGNWEGKGPSDDAYGWQSIPKYARFDRQLVLDFNVMEVHGDWFIDSECGDRFTNGTLSKRAAPDGSAWDRRISIVRPSGKFLQQILPPGEANRLASGTAHEAGTATEHGETESWLKGRELGGSKMGHGTAHHFTPSTLEQRRP